MRSVFLGLGALLGTLLLAGGCPEEDDCLGATMVSIPAGTFTMGSPVDEIGRSSHETQHQVMLTRDFEIGEVEVTQEQFKACMGYNPSGFSPRRERFDTTCYHYPVESVSWHEAAAFANCVSEAEGLVPCYTCDGSGEYVSCERDHPYGCEGYRLPTEAEWEYAARGGLAEQAFPNGGGLNPGDDQNCDGDLQLDNGHILDDEAWYCGNADLEPHPVGGLDANGYGLFDMSGNVKEWCHDWYDHQYSGEETDPYGPDSGSNRVTRGGSYSDFFTANARVAKRGGMSPDYNNIGYQGFRLARTVP